MLELTEKFAQGGRMKNTILKSGGVAVAVLIRPTQDQIDNAKVMLKAVWPEDRITITHR